MIPLYLKRRLLNKAKRMAPEDTGNLRFNAIRGLKWTSKDKFTIRYDGNVANYIEYLQNYEFAGGSRNRRNVHKGFIDRFVLELINDVTAHYSGTRRDRREGTNYDKYKNDLYGLQKRTDRYLRSLAINELRRDINDSTRSTKTINI